MNTSTRASLLSTLITLATGIILCVAYGIQDSTRIIIFIAGASFMIASLVNIVMLCDSRDRQGRRKRSVFSSTVGWIASVAGVALGLTMLLTPQTFVSSLVILFGAILVLTGIYQFVVYARGLPGYSFAAWTYLLPLMILADGAVMLFYSGLRQPDNGRYTVLLMGIGLILAAIANAIVYVEVARYNRRLRRGELLPSDRPAIAHGDREEDDNPIEPSI